MALTTLTGALAVVTGAASGIGLATARALYGRGAHVVLADLNAAGLADAERLLTTAAPESGRGRLVTMTTDVTDEGQVQALMERAAADEPGRIDLVVTSAGIGRSGPIDTFSAQEMQALLTVNFMGTFHCVKAALPFMRRQGSGHFVFLSSVAGKLPVPALSGYCASKWAVRGFATALRAELAESGIGVTTVYPSWVDTPMVHQESASQLLHIQPLLKPEQVAEEILKAVLENRRDLTLAPDRETALILEIMQNDPDKAEDLMGRAFRGRLAALEGRSGL
jgi:NAD(P)-dependent dehydrogenase (short-subunit alcohol dehydrogenase family)